MADSEKPKRNKRPATTRLSRHNGGQVRRKSRKTWAEQLQNMQQRRGSISERAGLQEGYRSGLESKVGRLLGNQGIGFEFETLKIRWVSLPLPHTYTPDFIIKTPAGTQLIIETKGRFMPEDMNKHLAVKLQHPELDIRFVFHNSKAWYRSAKTRSYAKWCEENGFKFCDFKDFNAVIQQWLRE